MTQPAETIRDVDLPDTRSFNPWVGDPGNARLGPQETGAVPRLPVQKTVSMETWTQYSTSVQTPQKSHLKLPSNSRIMTPAEWKRRVFSLVGYEEKEKMDEHTNEILHKPRKWQAVFLLDLGARHSQHAGQSSTAQPPPPVVVSKVKEEFSAQHKCTCHRPMEPGEQHGKLHFQIQLFYVFVFCLICSLRLVGIFYGRFRGQCFVPNFAWYIPW